MSTTQSSPSISPTVDSPSLDTTPPPSSDTSAPPPISGSSTPPPPNSPPPTPDLVTPPPVNSEPPTSPVVVSSPPSSTPPPATPNAPPPSTSTPSTPNVPPPSTPPPSTPNARPPPSTPNAPPPTTPPLTPNAPPPPSTPNAPPPSITPPSTPNAPLPPSTPNAPPPSTTPPSTPNAPPPIDTSPPPPTVPSPPPPKNSSSRPSPSPPPPQRKPEVPPPSPSPPVHNASPPSIPVPPKQSPPVPAVGPPPADSSAPPVPAVLSPPNATFPSPTVPASSSPPPPQNNTSISPNAPPTDSSPETTNNTTASTTREAGGISAGGAIAIVFAGLLALSLVVFAAWFVQKRKKKRTGSNQGYMVPSPFVSSPSSDSVFLRDQNAAIGSARQSPYHSSHLNGSSSKTNLAYNGDPGGVGNSKPWFTYEELVEATNGFSEDNLLGEGGFGCVYKGNLADGREVAVKQLKIGGKQGEREFRAEVDIISRIHHRHLVSIVGYCISDFQRLLVYDYVPNNTLHYHLHGNVPAMTWVTRFKVASGAARGIAYLHEDCTPRIIHRDIKSSNILLDNKFEAKVADFGLAKLALDLESHTHVSTRVMGTFGYMAPEYATTGKLTEKSDVFSFGVVLLELITGRKPVDSSQPLGDESLVGWICLCDCILVDANDGRTNSPINLPTYVYARPLLTKALESEDFDNMVDLRLENNFVKIQMFRLIEAAAACVRHSASKRPKMSQVVRALDSIGEVSDLSNGMKPGDSQIIDSREQSAQIRMFQRMAFGPQDYGSDFSSNSRNSWSGL